MIVAIDGPAGPARARSPGRLAERLGFRYLDTGAMYRALTWLAMREGLPLGDGRAARQRSRARIPSPSTSYGRVFIAGTDVTAEHPRSRASTAWFPSSPAIHEVREVMRERQRELAVARQRGDRGPRHRHRRRPRRRAQGLPRKPIRRCAPSGASVERPDIGADALATDLQRADESDRARMQPAGDAVRSTRRELEVDDVVARIEELFRERQPALP